MDRYTSDVFTSLVGQVFHFHRNADATDSPICLELVDVESSAQRNRSDDVHTFSLLFALQRGEATSQSTLHLRHDAFEPCVWFINRVVVPGRDPHTPYYEAVFG